MKKVDQLFLFLLLYFPVSSLLNAQCATMNIEQQSEFPSIFTENVLTAKRDAQGRDFLYAASKEGGIKIIDIADLANPELAIRIPTSSFEDLDVMNLHQKGNYLYAAIGNHLGLNEQRSGIAIIDVTDPRNPVVTDHWILPGSDTGSGIVVTAGNYAYLGAMEDGLVVLDITDKQDIRFVSLFNPDFTFPHGIPPGGIDSAKFNARGLAIQNDLAYLCHDRGGLRIIDLADKENPKEIGRYCFSNLIGYATAYNNVVVNGDLAYVTIDYYGVEILDISDPANIRQIGWWKPDTWPDATNALNEWAGAPGHASEIEYAADCDRIFVAAGKSDLLVISVEDPANPILCDTFGTSADDRGTWGLGIYENEVYLGYIFTLFAPPFSNWTGVGILQYDACSTTSVTEADHLSKSINVYPNPSEGHYLLDIDPALVVKSIELYDSAGRRMTHYSSEIRSLDLSGFEKGIYFLRVETRQEVTIRKLLIL